ncbi:UNVERIFIED_ORG: hypothetical protein J2W38_002278 [Variovorax paradoxus]|jgi:hypothetical protein|nr:hypothetical protein [Variovorax paradoxus]
MPVYEPTHDEEGSGCTALATPDVSTNASRTMKRGNLLNVAIL